MSYHPSAPPPSYDDIQEKNSRNNEPPMGFQTSPSSTAQYNYSQVPLNHSQVQQSPVQLQPQPQPQRQVIVVQGGPMMFGPHATRLVCPACQNSTLTRIEHKSSATTHIIAGILCIMGCCCLAPIPYFIDSCKNSVHYCTDCGSYLGTYSNSGNRGYR